MPIETPPVSLRIAFVVIGLTIWFLTQRLIKYRPVGTGVIGDGLHTLTAPLYRWLLAVPRRANVLLAVSSAGIDLLGIFVLGWCILGPSVGPFVGLLVLFSLRQICQAVCALPPPKEMIWRSPGVPTVLVTYDVANDLFFSGHSALAVFGTIQLGIWGGPAWVVVGVLLALFEMAAVIILRAHYTMDVYAGAITAVLAAQFGNLVGPSCDRWLISLGQAMGLN